MNPRNVSSKHGRSLLKHPICYISIEPRCATATFAFLTKQLKGCGMKSKLQENLENELQVDKEETGISRQEKIM